MGVVAGSELRLDHHPGAGAAVAAYQVGAEPPHRGFPPHGFQVEPERAAESVEAFVRRKPGDEFGRLALPDGRGVDGIEICESAIIHRAILRFALQGGAGTKKGRRNLRRPHFA